MKTRFSSTTESKEIRGFNDFCNEMVNFALRSAKMFPSNPQFVVNTIRLATRAFSDYAIGKNGSEQALAGAYQRAYTNEKNEIAEANSRGETVYYSAITDEIFKSGMRALLGDDQYGLVSVSFYHSLDDNTLAPLSAYANVEKYTSDRVVPSSIGETKPTR